MEEAKELAGGALRGYTGGLSLGPRVSGRKEVMQMKALRQNTICAGFARLLEAKP
jgi:hypothetical protein